MSKPREFWIKQQSNDREAFVIPFDVDRNKTLIDPRCLHVIEYSAYAELERQNKIMREALEKIAIDFGTDYCDGNCMVAHDALNEVDKK